MRAEIEPSKRRLVLHLSGEDDRELEEWTVRAKSDLLRDVFDLDVQLAGGAASAKPEGRDSRSPPPGPGK